MVYKFTLSILRLILPLQVEGAQGQISVIQHIDGWQMVYKFTLSILRLILPLQVERAQGQLSVIKHIMVHPTHHR